MLKSITMFCADLTTTVIGSGSSGLANGVGSTAAFASPRGLCVSSDNSFALVSDSGNHLIRRIDLLTWKASTVAGNGLSGNADGSGTFASFNLPMGMAINYDDRFALITEYSNHNVRKLMLSTATVTTLAGSGQAGSADGMGTYATFCNPHFVTISGDGNYALVGGGMCSNVIRKIVLSTAMVSTFVGSSQGYADGVGTLALFYRPTSTAISSDGSYCLVTDATNNRIRKVVVSTRIVTTFAGNGSTASKDGFGLEASIYYPYFIQLSVDDSYALIASSKEHVVYRLDLSTAYVTTVAGSHKSVGHTDGIGTTSKFNEPYGLAMYTRDSMVLLADTSNHVIRNIGENDMLLT